jgi:hypothetical protein
MTLTGVHYSTPAQQLVTMASKRDHPPVRSMMRALFLLFAFAVPFLNVPVAHGQTVVKGGGCSTQVTAVAKVLSCTDASAPAAGDAYIVAARVYDNQSHADPGLRRLRWHDHPSEGNDGWLCNLGGPRRVAGVPKKRPRSKGSALSAWLPITAASLGAIPSWLAPFPRAQVRADSRDANAAEAIPHL